MAGVRYRSGELILTRFSDASSAVHTNARGLTMVDLFGCAGATARPVPEAGNEVLTRGMAHGWSLFRILCKCLFSEVTVQAVTELDNKAAHCYSPVLQRHCPFLGR